MKYLNKRKITEYKIKNLSYPRMYLEKELSCADIKFGDIIEVSVSDDNVIIIKKL
jgi:hypothetical protein